MHKSRVVILGRLNAWTGGHSVHYVQYKPDILNIYSEYSLKIPRIYSNMLDYTRTFPYQAGMKVYWA
jgi:hypothetical protein